MAASESIWFRSTPHPRIPPRPTLNGEGIDYGLETGRLVAELLADERHLGSGWPAILRRHYGEAFSIARRLAGLLTLLRVMGNLVTDEESARAAERGFALHVERAVDLAHAGSVADAYELQVRALLVQWLRMPGPVIARWIGWPYSEGSVSLPPTWTARRVRPSGCGRRARPIR